MDRKVDGYHLFYSTRSFRIPKHLSVGVRCWWLLWSTAICAIVYYQAKRESRLRSMKGWGGLPNGVRRPKSLGERRRRMAHTHLRNICKSEQYRVPKVAT